MATLYVTKAGNDSTGNGTVGTPYLTVNKAITVCSAGDSISVGAGTYQETSGSGYLLLNRSFTPAVTIFSATGVNTDVVIQSASGTVAEVLCSGTGYTFQNISFTSRANTVPIVFSINSTTTNLVFTNCIFTVASSGIATNSCVSTSFGTGTTNGPFTFTDCIFTSTGTNDADAVTFSNPGSSTTINSLTFTRCSASCYRRGLNLAGVTNIMIDSCNIQCVSPTNSLHALIFGVDGPQSGTTYACSGTVKNSTFATLNGHAAVIGAGVTSATVQGNRFIGGNSLTSGQGLVIKEATNAVVTDNLVYGGYFSGLYVKGAQSPTVRRNTVINLYSTSACVRVEKNITDPGALFSNSIFTDNYVVAQIGQMFSFNSIGSGENGSGSYYDRNIYDLRGTATWGNIRGTTVSSFSGVQSAWSSYASGTNEANSIVGSGAAAFTYRHTSTVGLFPASPFAGPCIYSIIYDLKGNVWNGTSFVIYVLANHHQYVNWLIEATPGSYRFITKVPLGLPAGDYIVETLSTTSLLATSADTKLGSEVFSWDGISRFSNQYLGVRAAQIKNNLLI